MVFDVFAPCESRPVELVSYLTWPVGHILCTIVGGTEVFDEGQVVPDEISRHSVRRETEGPLFLTVVKVRDQSPGAGELFGVIENLSVEIGKDQIYPGEFLGPSKRCIDSIGGQVACNTFPDERRGRVKLDGAP